MAAWRVGSIWKYLGFQDAPQNNSIARKYIGTRRGTKVHIIDVYIYNIIGEVKWAKTQLII